jgi:hypothetical protein
LAISSLILGILGFFTGITALPAVICGHLSLGRIKSAAGSLTGSGMAIAGLVMGYLVISVFAAITAIAFLAGLALPLFGEVQERGKATRDLSQAKQIALAIMLYEQDNDGRTPPSLDILEPDYLPDRSIFVSPLTTESHSQGYELLLPDTDTKTIGGPKTKVLLRGRYTTRRGLRSYIYLDGSGEVRRDR